MSEDDFSTDVDGKPVHPAVTEMAENLDAQKHSHLVLINWWKDGRIQYWHEKPFVPSDIYTLVRESGWQVQLTETREEGGKERGYAEFCPREFDPEAFSQAGE